MKNSKKENPKEDIEFANKVLGLLLFSIILAAILFLMTVY